jgi:peptidoglycan/xylan/chitin deacetylase (PgdA/CDA1 family)
MGPPLMYPAKAALTRARSLTWRARAGGRLDSSGLRILCYHRVSDEEDELAVSPRRFAAQMAFLADEGFRVIDCVEAAAALASSERQARTIGLTFDDGYRDVHEHALPVLERHGFRATVFVATGVIEGRAHFDWYRIQPPLLSFEDIAALDGGTFRFEAHTVNHPNLLALSDADARAEIFDGKHELEERLGRVVEAFCYPAGLFSARERALVAEASFRIAVTTEPGVNRAGDDLLALRRRQIDHRDSLLDFRAKVGGGHDSSPPGRAAWRRLRYGAGSGS